MTKIDKLTEISSFCQHNNIPYNFGNIKFSAFVEYNSPSYKKMELLKSLYQWELPKKEKLDYYQTFLIILHI